jgi:hypothetical protein
MFVNDLILNACVKTTDIFVSEKILTTFGNKCINISLPSIHIFYHLSMSFFKQFNFA